MGLSQNLNYQVQIVQTFDNGNPPIRVIAPLASEQFMMDLSAQFSAPWSGGLLTDPKLTTISSAAFGVVPIVQGMTAQVWAGATETELGIDLSLQAEFDAEFEVRNVIKDLFRLVTPSVGPLGFLVSPGPKVDWRKVAESATNAAQKLGINTTALGLPDASQPTPTSPGTQKQGDMVDNTQTISDGSQTSVPSANPSDDKNLGTSANPVAGFIKDKISLRIGRNLFFDNVVLTNVQVTEENQFDGRGFPMFARVSLRFKPLFIIVQSDLDTIFGVPQSEPTALGQTPTAGANVEVNPIDLPGNIPAQELPPPGPTTESFPVWEPKPTERFPVNL